MVGQRTRGGGIGRDVSKRAERAQRILGAAAELIQRWGYRKTTIDDIARQARVAKGTIYLHWKTREELFLALVEREEASLRAEIARGMETDPEGMTLPGLIKHSMLATLKNPLAKALVLQDTEFLGELATHEYSTTAYQAQVQGYMAILEFLRTCGVIRNDVGLREQALTIISVSWGFLLINPLLPDDFASSDEQIVEMVDAALKRLLEPDAPPTEDERRAGSEAMRTYLAQITALAQQVHGETETYQ